MKRLLIGYDGSECATAALDNLRVAGLPHDLDVKVLTAADVWLPAESDRLEPVYPDVEAKAVRRAREAAFDIVTRAQATAAQGSAEVQKMFPSWRIQSQALADSPAWGIVRVAREFHADLVVVGSHGRSLLERFFLGSVAQKVAAEAHCSVRICKPRPSGPAAGRNILIALDGSKDSEAAVRAVLERRWPADTHFKLVTVLDDRLESAVAWSGGYARRWVLKPDADAREAAFRMIEKHASDLYGAGLEVDTHLYRGEPKETLLKAVHDLAADCIFIGAHGLHHQDRPSLGTVASAVATRVHCTVEIVRAG